MPTRGWNILIASILLLTIAFGHPNQTPPPEFSQTVLASFDRWDLNHDGILEQDEVWKAFGDETNKDLSGAALAAIAHWYTMDARVKSLSRSFFENYKPIHFEPIPEGTPPESVKRIRFERAMAGVHLQSEFVANLWRIRNTPRVLFEEGGPRFTDIQQGGVGDCWLVAHFGAVVHRDPGEIRSMIVETDSGYRVFFPDRTTLDVPRLTDAQIGLDDVKMNHGLWVRVLRVAFYHRPKVIRKDAYGHPYAYEAKAMEGLTGSAMRVVRLVNDYSKSVPSEKLDSLLDSVRKDLTAMVGNKKLAVVESGMVPMPFGITGNHSFAVFDFDPATDMVTLWNPWGDTYRPQPGTDGLKDYSRTNGVFRAPLSVIVRSCRDIIYEQDGKFIRP